jgi:hypothetical protein
MAANWTAAYDDYASDAENSAGASVATKQPDQFKQTLIQLLPPVGTAAQAAAAFDAAFIKYWTGGAFNIDKAPASGVGGDGTFGKVISSNVAKVQDKVLGGLLLPILVTTTMDPEARAKDVAAAFHTATTTAIVVVTTGTDTTPPPNGPVAIANTAGVQ